MSPSLPPRASLEWLRKAAKDRLAALRRSGAKAKLADAQRLLARDYGFASWRKLKAHVEAGLRTPAAAVVLPADAVLPADEVVQQFFRLVGMGEDERVRAALDAAPQFVNAVGPHPFWGGRPQALHVAVEAGQREIFDLLLDRGADVNGRNDQYDRWSPLMLAIQRERMEMRDELLRRGARVGIVEALMLGDDTRLDQLLRGEDLLAREAPNGGSFLAFARTAHAVDRLLALGEQPGKRDRWGLTPVGSLSRLGSRGAALVQQLAARGASVTAEEYARLGDLQAIAELVARDPALVQSGNLLVIAADSRHHLLVEWLLQHEANVNARAAAQSHQTALHCAAWNGDLRMAQLLLAAGADPTLHDDEHGTTPLAWAEIAAQITNNAKCLQVAELLRGVA